MQNNIYLYNYLTLILIMVLMEGGNEVFRVKLTKIKKYVRSL